MKAFFAVAVLFLAAGCSRSDSTPSTQPSSKHYGTDITNVARAHFPKGGDALVLEGTTEIPIEDMVTLRKAADQIWADYRKKAEAAGLTNGVIRLSSPATGFISRTKGYGFVYEERADGKWHCLDDDKK